MTSLNHDFPTLSNWFYKNFMVLHLDKCSFMLFGIKDELQTDLLSNNVTTKNSKQEKVLGITFDNKLDFSSHLTSITKKVKNIKLNSLTRVQKCMTPGRKILLTVSPLLFSNLKILFKESSSWTQEHTWNISASYTSKIMSQTLLNL